MEKSSAFEYCEKIAKSHYENFPVGLFVPLNLRKYVYCIYAFARTADDIADDETVTAEIRLRKLNEYDKKIDDCYMGISEDPIFEALEETVSKFTIPKKLLKDLLYAFKMDVEKNRHSTFEDLLFYSSHSANPVGRLILILFNIKDEKMYNFSDNICTALQLANFWQDITIDLKKDRIYIPLSYLNRFKYSEDMLFENVYNDNFKELMKELIIKTQNIFNEGKNLINFLYGKLKFEIILTHLGGNLILKKIIDSEYDIFNRRPIITNKDKALLLIKTIYLWMK
jgi:hydroxysqualene synthase